MQEITSIQELNDIKMDIVLERKKNIEKTFRLVRNKSRKCLFAECKQSVINSHVFQKNGILNQIASKNHLYKVEPTSAFEFSTKGTLTFKRIGINDAFAFPGFCKEHDNTIFKPLERKIPNFLEEEIQYLIGYRTLCQEIRRKEIAHEMMTKTDYSLFHPTSISHFRASAGGFLKGLESLNHFKAILEEGIVCKDFSNYSFETIKIPRIELCVAAPLTLSYERLIHLPQNVRIKTLQETPIETTIFNCFPAIDCSYVIIGFAKGFTNNWATEMDNLFKESSKKTIFKALSDIVSSRCEFWCMSEKVFSSIPKNLKDEYKRFFMNHVLDHSKDILVSFNLFENLD